MPLQDSGALPPTCGCLLPGLLFMALDPLAVWHEGAGGLTLVSTEDTHVSNHYCDLLSHHAS